MSRFAVFLVRSQHRDGVGNLIQHAERRLVRQTENDRIIAIVQAPKGSRIQSRKDPNGPDQLVVPLRSSFFGRLFAPRVVIPAKYLVGDARNGAYGLSLVQQDSEGRKP